MALLDNFTRIPVIPLSCTPQHIARKIVLKIIIIIINKHHDPF